MASVDAALIAEARRRFPKASAQFPDDASFSSAMQRRAQLLAPTHTLAPPDTSTQVDATTPPGHGGSSIISDLTSMAVRPVVAGKRLVTGQAQREHTLGADAFDTALGVAQVALPLVRGASAATGLLRAVGEGAAIGAGGEAVRALDDRQGLPQSLRRMAGGAVMGGALGAGGHALFRGAARATADPVTASDPVAELLALRQKKAATPEVTTPEVTTPEVTKPRTVPLKGGTVTQGGYGDAAPLKPVKLREGPRPLAEVTGPQSRVPRVGRQAFSEETMSGRIPRSRSLAPIPVLDAEVVQPQGTPLGAQQPALPRGPRFVDRNGTVTDSQPLRQIGRGAAGRETPAMTPPAPGTSPQRRLGSGAPTRITNPNRQLPPSAEAAPPTRFEQSGSPSAASLTPDQGMVGARVYLPGGGTGTVEKITLNNATVRGTDNRIVNVKRDQLRWAEEPPTGGTPAAPKGDPQPGDQVTYTHHGYEGGAESSSPAVVTSVGTNTVKIRVKKANGEVVPRTVAKETVAPQGFTAREGGLGSESMPSREGHVYRGMTSEEYEATLGSGKGVQSRGDYSHPSEGTVFSTSPQDAESYANFGRDDPRKTGRPTYLVEVNPEGLPGGVAPDGYHKIPGEVPRRSITRVWKMEGDGERVVASPTTPPPSEGSAAPPAAPQDSGPVGGSHTAQWRADKIAQIQELDALGTDDAAYQMTLSTGTKEPLRPGETWRNRVMRMAGLTEDDVARSPETHARILQEYTDRNAPHQGHTVHDTGKGKYRYQVLDPTGQPVKGSVGSAPMRFASEDRAWEHVSTLNEQMLIEERAQAGGGSTGPSAADLSETDLARRVQTEGKDVRAAAHAWAKEADPEGYAALRQGTLRPSELATRLLGRGSEYHAGLVEHLTPKSDAGEVVTKRPRSANREALGLSKPLTLVPPPSDGMGGALRSGIDPREVATAMREMGDYFVSKADDHLKRLGKPGKLVVEGFKRADHLAEARAGQVWDDLRTLGYDDPLDFPSSAAVTAFAEGHAPLEAVPEHLRPVAERVKGIFQAFQQARHDAGMHTTQGDYLPHDFRFNQLRTDPTYRAEALEMAKVRGMDNPEPVLDAMLDLEKNLRPDHPFVQWYLGEHPDWMQGEPDAARAKGFLDEFSRQRLPDSQETFGHMRERVLDLPFYDHNINRILSAYVGGAARTIERAKIFGHPGSEDYLLKPGSPLYDMIPTAMGRGAFTTAVNRKLGVGKEALLPGEKQAFQDKRSLDAFKIGPTAGVVNYLNAPLGIFQHSGYDLPLTLKSLIQSRGGFAPDAVNAAVRSGSIEASVPKVAGRRHGLFGQDDVGGDLRGRIRQGYNRASKTYQTAGSGMIPTEQAGRTWADTAGRLLMEDAQRNPTSRRNRVFLDELGGAPPETAGNFFSRRVMGSNRPGDLPPMFDNPMWRLANPLKNFMYLQGRETLEGLARAPQQVGPLGALVGGGAFVGGNLAAGDLRRRFEDRWRTTAGEDVPERTGLETVAQDLRYSPLLGAFSDVLSMGAQQGYGALPVAGMWQKMSQGEGLTQAQKRWLMQGGPIQVGAMRYPARLAFPNQ